MLNKQYKYIIYFLLFAIITHSTEAQNITAFEYFFDKDPGAGKGIALNVSSPNDIIENDFEIDISGLSAGAHRLVVRAKDENSAWSLSLSHKFYIQSAAQPQTDISVIGLEYFIDTDPGVGNATYVNAMQSNDAAVFDIQENIQSLQLGRHTIGLRVQGKDQLWSFTRYSPLFITETIQKPPTTSTVISQIEYFFNDTDPGINRGVKQQVAEPAENVIVIDSVGVDTVGSTGLVPGNRHFLLVRAKTNEGVWGIPNVFPFDYCRVEGVVANFDYELSGRNLTIQDSSLYAQRYRWDLGDGSPLQATPSGFSYTYAQGGDYSVCQIVSNQCRTDTFCTDITVTAPRVVKQLHPVSVNEGNNRVLVEENINTIFEEPSGNALTYTVDLVSVSNDENLVPVPETAARAFLEADTSIYVESFGNTFGNYHIRMTASTVEDTVVYLVLFRVVNVNDPPVRAIPVPDASFDEDTPGTTVTRNLLNSFKDIDNRFLNFELRSSAPEVSGVFFPNRVGRDSALYVSAVPNYFGQSAMYLSVSDDEFSVFDTFLITVNPLPDALKLTTPVPNFQLDEDAGAKVIIDSLDIYFSELERGALDFSVNILSPPLPDTVIQIFEQSKVRVHTPEDFDDNIQVEITAANSLFTAKDRFTITINGENDAPVFFKNIPDSEICPGHNLTINLADHLREPEDTYAEMDRQIQVLSKNPEDLANDGISFSVSGDQAIFRNNNRVGGSYEIALTFMDSEGASASDTLSLSSPIVTLSESEGGLLASNGTSYQWFVNNQQIDGANRQTYRPTQVGTYTIKVQIGACSILSTPVIITSQEDDDLTANTLLYPNPVSQRLFIQITSPEQGYFTLYLRNVYGKLLKTISGKKHTESFQETLDMQNYPTGLYFIEITLGNISIIKKVIKLN